jgi:uncharacterized protein (DUF433 family)
MAILPLVERRATGKEMDRLLKAKYRKGIDSREQPLYTLSEAARFLGINSQTLTTWLFGRSYDTKAGPQRWKRVIVPADEKLRLLSFYNLAEAHVLAATRYEHEVPFPAVRNAIDRVTQKYPASSKHPLLADDFFTEGKKLFVKTINEIVNLSDQQLSLSIMDSFLVRVLRDDDHNPFKIYPLRRGEPDDKVISIVAGVSQSRPIIDASGIPVLAVWRRFKAGEEPEFIAQDFEVDLSQVNRAISYFERRAA